MLCVSYYVVVNILFLISNYYYINDRFQATLSALLERHKVKFLTLVVNYLKTDYLAQDIEQLDSALIVHGFVQNLGRSNWL